MRKLPLLLAGFIFLGSATIVFAADPSATPSPTPAATATGLPSPTPSSSASTSPSPTPSGSPSPSPSYSSSPTPSPSATVKASPTPTIKATSKPTPSPSPTAVIQAASTRTLANFSPDPLPLPEFSLKAVTQEQQATQASSHLKIILIASIIVLCITGLIIRKRGKGAQDKTASSWRGV